MHFSKFCSMLSRPLSVLTDDQQQQRFMYGLLDTFKQNNEFHQALQEVCKWHLVNQQHLKNVIGKMKINQKQHSCLHAGRANALTHFSAIVMVMPSPFCRRRNDKNTNWTISMFMAKVNIVALMPLGSIVGCLSKKYFFATKLEPDVCASISGTLASTNPCQPHLSLSVLLITVHISTPSNIASQPLYLLFINRSVILGVNLKNSILAHFREK